MDYVPTPVYTPHVSAQAQELAHKIEHVIREYQQSHPGLSATEVGQAIQMAGARTGVGPRRARLMVAAMLGLTVALLLGALLFWRGM